MNWSVLRRIGIRCAGRPKIARPCCESDQSNSLTIWGNLFSFISSKMLAEKIDTSEEAACLLSLAWRLKTGGNSRLEFKEIWLPATLKPKWSTCLFERKISRLWLLQGKMFAWLSVGRGVGLITFEGTDRNTLILPSTVSHLTWGNTEWNINNIQLSWLRLSEWEESTEKRPGWVPRPNYQWYQTLESSDLLKSCHHQRSLREVITLSQAHNSHQTTNEYKYWNGFI